MASNMLLNNSICASTIGTWIRTNNVFILSIINVNISIFFSVTFIFRVSLIQLTLIKDSTVGLSINVFKNIISVSLAFT